MAAAEESEVQCCCAAPRSPRPEEAESHASRVAQHRQASTAQASHMGFGRWATKRVAANANVAPTAHRHVSQGESFCIWGFDATRIRCWDPPPADQGTKGGLGGGFSPDAPV
jgi:hypothetical protein